MKNNFRKFVTAVVLITGLYGSWVIAKEKSLPLTSSEEITFLDTKDQALFKLNKSQDFIGVLHRTSISDEDQSMMDLYHFKNVSIKKMDKDQCTKLGEVIYGPFKDITLKAKDPELFQSPRSGMVCKIVFEDPDKEAQFKERHLFVFVNNNRTFALSGRFKKQAATEDTEDLHRFVKSLR
ncbi:hypothetical protein ACES2L_00620 [Bdellovibrio bacteriovorus]